MIIILSKFCSLARSPACCAPKPQTDCVWDRTNANTSQTMQPHSSRTVTKLPVVVFVATACRCCCCCRNSARLSSAHCCCRCDRDSKNLRASFNAGIVVGAEPAGGQHSDVDALTCNGTTTLPAPLRYSGNKIACSLVARWMLKTPFVIAQRSTCLS